MKTNHVESHKLHKRGWKTGQKLFDVRDMNYWLNNCVRGTAFRCFGMHLSIWFELLNF